MRNRRMRALQAINPVRARPAGVIPTLRYAENARAMTSNYGSISDRVVRDNNLAGGPSLLLSLTHC
jgi:hypothetical protein